MTQTTSRPLRWLQVLVLLLTQLAWIVLLSGGLVQLARGFPAIGLGLIVLGLITAVLAIRRLRAGLARTPNAQYDALDRGPAFDYIIWSLFGLPLVGGLIFLIVFLVGGFR